MSSENKVMSQKEYLKKYLSSDKDVKKKKKKRISSSTVLKRSQIIDDDVDLNSMRVLEEGEVDLYQLDEDAPQIVGIIDERPPEVQALENFKKRMRLLGIENSDGDFQITDNFEQLNPDLFNQASNVKSLKPEVSVSSKGKHRKNSGDDSDMSPPRKSRRGDDSDMSPPRNKQLFDKKYKRKEESDSDFSPPRKKSLKKHDSGSDLSPPRKVSTHRKNNKLDLSPPSKSSSAKRNVDKDSDLSPPRINSSRKRGETRNLDSSPPKINSFRKRKEDSDSDLSPHRRNESSRKTHYTDTDLSSLRRSHINNQTNKDYCDKERSYKDYRDSDRKYGKLDSHNRGHYSDKYHDRNSQATSRNLDYKKERRKEYDRDDYKHKFREFRKSDDFGHRPKSRFNDGESDCQDKMNKTLDGKRAGLQDATQLKKELSNFKEKEDKMFSKLSADLSGQNAATIIRDRKTGLKRDFVKERREALEKGKKAAEQNEKYEKWGRGMKQIEEAAERFANAVHEMSKPVARYADDDDLDKFLKEQEREGDPMLDYIKNKQREAIPLTGAKPKYEGSFMPNRFGIRPGYRWDGVDRSSGYEKQWFTSQNNRKARDDEAYKWSTSDM